MKSIAKSVFWLLIAVLSIAAGSAYWIGREIEKQTATAYEIKRFERGWFASSASSRFALPDLPPLALKHRVFHGLLPLDGQRPALAAVHTTLAQDSYWCRQLDALCAEDALVSRIDLDGVSRHSFALPALRGGDIDIAHLDAELRLPLLGDPLHAGLNLTVGRLYYPALAVAAREGRLRIDLTPTRTRVGGDLELTADALTLADVALAAVVLRLQAHNLHRPSLERLFRQPGLTVDTLVHLQGVLQHRPRLNLRSLQLRAQQGALRAYGELTLQAVNVFALLAAPLRIVETGELYLSVDEAWLDFARRYWPAFDGVWRLRPGDNHIRIDNGQLFVNRDGETINDTFNDRSSDRFNDFSIGPAD